MQENMKKSVKAVMELFGMTEQEAVRTVIELLTDDNGEEVIKRWIYWYDNYCIKLGG